MNINIVQQYVDDAKHAHEVCMASFQLTPSAGVLSTLLTAARRRDIARQGEVHGPTGEVYEYKVHGSGYSFKDRRSNKDIRFDVTSIDGTDRIRFSPWELLKYLESLGEPASEEVIASELRVLSEVEPRVVRIADGTHEYFYWDGL